MTRTASFTGQVLAVLLRKVKKSSFETNRKRSTPKKKADSSNSDAEEVEDSFNEDVDSATYSDDVSGVWSLKSDN